MLPNGVEYEKLKKWNDLLKDTTKTEQERKDFLEQCSDATKDFIKENNEGAISLENFSIKAQLANLKTQALAFGMKLLNAAITAGAIWLLTEGVTLLIKKLDEWNVTSEEIQEAAENARSSIDKIKSSFDSLSSSVEKSKERYAELAQGINQITGENKSLSTDEYKEFLDLSNQLSELFPSLTKNYDENGNAILDLSGNVGSIADQLDSLVEVQRELANQEIMEKMPDVFAGMKDNVKKYNEELDNLNNKLAFNDSIKTSYFDNLITSDITEIELIDKVLKEIKGPDIKKYIDQTVDNEGLTLYKFEYDFTSMTEEELQKFNKKLNEIINSNGINIQKQISETNSKIKSELTSFGKYVNTWLSQSFNFQQVGLNLGEKYQSALRQILTSTNDWYYDAIAELGDKATWDDISQWVTDNYINGLMKIDDNEIKDKFLSLFTEDLPVAEKLKIAEELQRYFDTHHINIKINPVVSNEQDAKNRLNESLVNLSKNNKPSYAPDDYTEARLVQFTKDFKEEDIEMWLEVTREAKNAEDAIRRFQEAKYQASQQKIFSKSEMVEALTALDDGFDKLDDLYADVADGKTFDFAKITSKDFKDNFSNLDGYDELVESIASNPKKMTEETQEAFNKLVTSYVNQSELLKGISEDTKDLVKDYLEMIGVTNAEEVAQKALNAQLTKTAASEQYYAWAKKQSADTELDLEKATYQEIDAMIAEANVTKEVAELMSYYSLSKKMADKDYDLGKEEIVQLSSLAEQCGYTTAEVDTLASAINILNKVSNGEIVSEASFNHAKKVIDDFRNNFNKHEYNPITIKPGDVNYTSPKSVQDATQTKETFDWIETAIKRVQEALSRLTKVRDNVYKTWGERNNALAGEIGEVNKELQLQVDAYDAYMKKANSVALSDEYKALVMNGGLRIEDITDETLKENIKDFQSWYEKAIQAKDAIEDLKIKLSELAEQKFNNISTQFENEISLLTARKTQLDNAIAQTEARGYIVSRNFYDELAKSEQGNFEKLTAERDALLESLNPSVSEGTIEAYSEKWYELVGKINDVNAAIQESETQLIEYQNTIRQLNWDNFDRLQETIKRINEEADFLINLMSNDKMFDKETGAWTDSAYATLGLHAQNYNVMMSEADKYATELKKIQEELAKDPYNQTLIERERELQDAQRDSILSAEQEKQAMIDLAREGIQAQIDAMQELIDKKKESIDAEKSAYEWQKTIAEKTKNIANIQKQLATYELDNSEESKKKIQSLRNQLTEAQQDLKDTQYDKWIEDQEKMLDDMLEEYQKLMDDLLDDTNALIQDLIDVTNSNASTIASTITQKADDVGYSLSEDFKSIWSSTGDVVTKYGENFNSQLTGVNTTLGTIVTKNDEMIAAINSMSSSMITGINNLANSFNTLTGTLKVPTTANPSTIPNTPNPTNPSKTDVEKRVSADSLEFFLANSNFDTGEEDEDGNRIYTWLFLADDGTAEGLGLSYKNLLVAGVSNDILRSRKPFKLTEKQLEDALYDKKMSGYKKGLHNAKKDEWAWTSENGSEAIYRASDGAIYTPIHRGDKVYTAEMAEKLWNIAKGNYAMPVIEFNKPQGISNNSMLGGNLSITIDNINLPNVHNPEQFAGQFIDVLKNDNTVQKAIRSATVDLIGGKPKLGVRKY